MKKLTFKFRCPICKSILEYTENGAYLQQCNHFNPDSRFHWKEVKTI